MPKEVRNVAVGTTEVDSLVKMPFAYVENTRPPSNYQKPLPPLKSKLI
jgi:hypothetical protein